MGGKIYGVYPRLQPWSYTLQSLFLHSAILTFCRDRAIFAVEFNFRATWAILLSRPGSSAGRIPLRHRRKNTRRREDGVVVVEKYKKVDEHLIEIR